MAINTNKKGMVYLLAVEYNQQLLHVSQVNSVVLFMVAIYT